MRECFKKPRICNQPMTAILITGSSKGLGSQLAEEFNKRGQSVIVHGRSFAKIPSFALDSILGDINETSCQDNLLKAIKEHKVTTLILNAGIMSLQETYLNTPEEIDLVMQTNLLSPMKLASSVFKYFKEIGGGTFIFINSTHGIITQTRHSIYCASKHGLKGFSSTLRQEGKEFGIRVVDIHPAGMQNTFFERVGGRKSIAKCLRLDEVAKIVADTIEFESLNVDEVVLNRNK